MANIKQTVDFSQGTLNNLVVVNNKLQLSSVAAPSFSRNSIAYLSNGTLVNSNLPRYETGQFDKAVMVEEGTTNLLTANQSSVETDLTGLNPYISAGTVSIARDTTVSWHGVASAKATNTGTGVADLVIFVPYGYAPSVTVGSTYTFSVYGRISQPGTIRVDIDWYTSTFKFISRVSTNYSNVPANQFVYCTVTGTAPTNAAKAALNLAWTSAPAGGNLWWDGAQFEQKPYATSWTLGGSTRSAETLTIPNANVFNKSNWNLEFQFNPTSNQVVSNKTGYLWENYIDANNYYALKVGSDGKSYLEVKSNGTIYQTSTAAAPVLNVGTWYDIKIRGNGSLMAIAVNGTKISEVSYVEPVGNLPANMYIGSDHNGSNHANALFDDLRISAIARSDTEWTNAYTSGQPLPVDEWTTYLLRFDDNLNYGQGGYYISPEYDVSSVNKAARGKVYWQEDADGIQRIVYAKLDNQADWTQVTNGGLLPISAGDVLTNRKLQLKVKMLKVI